jgi:hypothetical protein
MATLRIARSSESARRSARIKGTSSEEDFRRTSDGDHSLRMRNSNAHYNQIVQILIFNDPTQIPYFNETNVHESTV